MTVLEKKEKHRRKKRLAKFYAKLLGENERKIKAYIKVKDLLIILVPLKISDFILPSCM